MGYFFLLKTLFPSIYWSIKGKPKEVYLTFDDGPDPVVTPEVLKLLNTWGAKATFFCIGDNAQKHPELIEEIRKHGHSLANHTMSHLNGWKTSSKKYLSEIEQASLLLRTNLFRPPYGRFKPWLLARINKKQKMILWSINSEDYDSKNKAVDCASKVLQDLKSGSVVLFHDSPQAAKNVLPALAIVLEKGSERGFLFAPIVLP